MSAYKPLSNPDFYKISEEILAFWQKEEIFEQSISSREGKESFTFYEGPPSANGTPGIHHVMARTIKDIFCRYQTLKGKQVKRKGGWDTHGLPIELQVEKELGITKDDIGKKISVEEYNRKCREAVMKFTDQWNQLTQMMGYWVDLENPYITYKNDYIESLWFLLKKLYDKNLLYKGYTIQPYSPAAGTGLSSHELNQPGTYKEVKDTSIVAQFKVKDWEKWSGLHQLAEMDYIHINGNELTDSQNLNEVRKIFKAYLLDVLRKEKYQNLSSSLIISLGGKGIKEIISFSPTIEETVCLYSIPQLIPTAKWMGSELSYKGEGSHYHYFLNKLKIESKTFWVKLVVQQIGKDYWLCDVALGEIKKSWNPHITQIPKSDDVDFPGQRKDTRFLSLLSTPNSFFLDRIKNQTSEPFILAWTTTPWTLPSNSALTVGKNIDYQLIETFNPYTYLPISVVCAKERVGSYFNEAGKEIDFSVYKPGDKIIPWKVVTECKGSQLEGIEYEQLMPYVKPQVDSSSSSSSSSLPFGEGQGGAAFRVILGDFVTTEDGTGVVHTAPTFGADDFRVAQQNGIPPIMVTGEDGKPMPLVNKQGRFVKEVTDYALEPVKEQYLTEEEKEVARIKQGRDKYLSVDERIGIKLKTENRAFNVQKFDHPYPHCWRTDKPVLYYPLDSWFIRTTAVKDKMIALNKQINWKPESTGTGRFGNWLENLVDWNLSRSRFWGTPLPIWRTEDGTEELCIGSVQQLLEEITLSIKSGKLSKEQDDFNLKYSYSARPHPKSLSKGEEFDSQKIANSSPLSTVEGLGVSSHSWLNFVGTADSKTWKNLKVFARENRKHQTEAESILWEALRNNALGYKIRRQHAIADFIADFACISVRLVIEIDGEYHSEPGYKEYDAFRTEFLNANDFEVIRFTIEEVIGDLEKTSSEILKALKDREDKIKNSPLPRRGAGGEVAFDLHRPFVDQIILVSPSGKPMTRETDLIDVWFDSGAMPYAQWHYPFENKEVFHNNFPADFISEGVDQTRGWFFTLHAIASMLSDDPEINNKLSPAFLNVVSTGLVLDKNGEKMSKRTGNVVNPFEAIRNYGPDPVRWYMITNSNPWDNLRFNFDGITEVRNKFFGTLANTYNFFALYANIDGYSVDENNKVAYSDLTELDRWVLSKLNSLVREVDGYYADYEPTKAGRAIQDFVSAHLSNWYVRLGRKRFWRGEMTDNKKAAYQTLHECLLTVSKLMSPIAPFFAEWLYRSITNQSASNSVHLTLFPSVTDSAIDPNLEAAMDLAQRTSSLVHSLRKNHKLKVRQPLGRMLVPVVSKEFRANLEKVEDLVLSEVNIKHLEYIEDTSGLVEKSAKPNFKKLGKTLGPKLKAFGELIAGLSQDQISQYERTGSLDVNLDGEKMTLVVEDLEIRSENIPGWVVASDQEITVALDLSISDELKMEGIARDVVNRVQNQRKDMGLEVMDRIRIRFEKTNNDLVTKALEANKEYICTETQANSLDIVEGLRLEQVLELDELSVNFDIVKS